MIVFFALCVVAGYLAGIATAIAMSEPVDPDRRHIDEMARRDRHA